MPTSTVQISRDPFARTTLERRVVKTNDTCSWCGQHRNFMGRPLANLFEYGTEPDGVASRINWHAGLFCSRSCHDSYHQG